MPPDLGVEPALEPFAQRGAGRRGEAVERAGGAQGRFEQSDVKKAILLEEATNGPRVRRIIVEGYAPDLNDVELERKLDAIRFWLPPLGGPDRVVVTREVSGAGLCSRRFRSSQREFQRPHH